MSERILHEVSGCSLENPQVEIHAGQALCPFSPSQQPIQLQKLDEGSIPKFACKNVDCNYNISPARIRVWKSAPMKKALKVSSQSQ